MTNKIPTRKSEIIALILRVLMGAWFVYAGGLKIFAVGLDRFVVDIENYRLVSGQLAVVVGYTIPWFEVVGGLCFMLGILRKGAWWVMFGLVMAFVVSVGSAWWRGLDISCGCLGGSEKISYWRKAAEFAVYLAALGWIAWVEWKSADVSKNSLPET
jgi:putative oxidoreductase